MTLKAKSEEHLCQLLLSESVEGTIGFGKVEGIQTKIETHSIKVGSTSSCKKKRIVYIISLSLS